MLKPPRATLRARRLRWGAAALLALLSSPTVAMGAAAPEYGIHPALSGRTTLSKGHFAYALGAGTAVHDAVVISNFTGAPLTFAVHGADMVMAEGGGLAPAPDGATSTGVGLWMRVNQVRVTVPPHRDASDALTVHVPAGQPPGEYLGAVVVTPVSSQPAGLQVLTRAALTVDVTVPGHLDLRVVPGSLTAAAQGDGELFSLTVTNAGNVLFNFEGRVTVRNDGGHVLAAVPLSPPGLYVIPGGSARVTASWNGLPRWGEVTAVATVDATVAGHPAGSFSSTTLHLSFFPWVLAAAGAGLVALLLLLLVVLLVRRRRRADQH